MDSKGRRQLMLYDAEQASGCWLGAMQSGGDDDLWERILLDVGLAVQVMSGLRAILASSGAVASAVGLRLSDSLQNKCNCNNRDPERFDEKAMKGWCAAAATLFNHSLLYLHWSGVKSRQMKCSICSGNRCLNKSEGKTMIRTTIPFLGLLKALAFTNSSNNSIAMTKSMSDDATQTSIANSFTVTTVIATTIDFVMGLLLGLTCIIYCKQIANCITICWGLHQNGWKQGLIWLQSNPFGVKMNRALTEQTILALQWILHSHERILISSYHFLAPHHDCANAIIRSVGILTTIFGSRFFFSSLFDALRLAFLHIAILSKFFAKCLQLELSTLSSLWLLFRGKKQNVLRLRSDHLHYDHMQLLLGMLLFSMCIFLFTTVVMHHWFFAAIAVIYELMLCGLWLVYMGVDSLFHIDKLLLREGQHRNYDVKLLPVSGDGDIVVSGINDACIGRWFSGTTDQFNVTAEEAKITSCVTIKSTTAVVSILSLSVTSGSDIVIGSFVLFLSSKLTRMVVSLSKILVASTCQIVPCCMDTTRSMQHEASSES